MPKELILRDIGTTGGREVGRLGGERILIGRDVPEGIVIQLEGISRNHGVFMASKSQWMYMDLDSTNGSWVNGVRVYPYSPRVIRSGDTLQLANAMFQLHESAGGGGDTVVDAPASLLLFHKDKVVDEFLVPSDGVALNVGGATSEIPLSGETEDQFLVVEASGGKLSVTHLGGEVEVQVNGQPLGGAVSLRDQDVITVEDFLVIVNDPHSSVRVRSRTTNPGITPAIQPWPSDHGSSSKVTAIAFGKPLPEDDNEIESTVAIEPSQLEDLRRGYSPKRGADLELTQERSERYAIIEESIIMVMAIGFGGAIVGISVWWFFFR